MEDPHAESTDRRRPWTVPAYILLGVLGHVEELIRPGAPGPFSVLAGLAISSIFWLGMWNGSRVVWWILVAAAVVLLPFTITYVRALPSATEQTLFVAQSLVAYGLLVNPWTYRWTRRGPRTPPDAPA